MPRFLYHALDANHRPVAGEVEAKSVHQAVGEVESRGLRIQSISLATVATTTPSIPRANSSSDVSSTARPTDAASVERAVLRAHMATIFERGRTIAPALQAYALELPSAWQRRQLTTVCEVLQRGDAEEAAAALAELPECWIPLLSAATVSTDAGQVLHDFLAESQRTEELRHKWWLALAYPLILAGLAMAVMIALSRFVIPEFRVIFEEFDLLLPDLTLFIIHVAAFLSTWGMLVLIAIAVMLVLVVMNAQRLLPTTVFRRLVNRLRPPFGRRTSIARFARFTADLLEAGVNMPDSLRIAGFTVNLRRTQWAAWQLANELESTGQFSPSAYQPALTAAVVHALGPETLPTVRRRLLRELSTCHAERVRSGLSWTSGIIEPLAICLVGFVVGCTVIGLFLPLVKLVEGLSM